MNENNEHDSEQLVLMKAFYGLLKKIVHRGKCQCYFQEYPYVLVFT